MPEAFVEKTQAELGAVISTPKLSEKLLMKPPFRFLHDIVTSFIKTTGFPADLYPEEMLDSANVSEKDSKILFLKLLIAAVEAATGSKTSAQPAKIVSGHEPENTNELLQLLASCAALSPEKKAEAVSAAKAAKDSSSEKKSKGDGSGDAAAAGSSKKRDEDDEERKKRHEEKRRKEKEGEEKSKGDEEKPKGDDEERKKKKEDDEERKKRHEEKRRKEKEAEEKSKGDEEKPRGDDEERKKKKEDDEERKKRHEEKRRKEKEAEEKSKGDEEKPKGDDEERKKKKEDDEERKKRHEEKRRKEKEAEEKSKGDDEERKKKKEDDEERKKRHEEKRRKEKEGSEKAKESPKEAPAEEKSSPVAGDDASEQPSHPAVRRTASAGKAPPRSKPTHEVVQDPNSNAASIAGVIRENRSSAKGGQDAEVEDENEWMRVAEQQSMKRSSDTGAGGDKGEARGYLGQQALQAKKEHEEEVARLAEKDARGPREGGIVIHSNRAGRTGGATMGESELSKLREQLQLLTKASNPLGKLLETIYDDIDTMSRELEMWRSEARSQALAASDARRQTTESLQEVHAQLQALEDAINDQILKTHNLRCSIINNDNAIAGMIRMIVNPDMMGR
ncbi:putative Microtubule binding protein MIP T3 [Trypanosoma vivax]|uniref:TRAF3-interacting protein 1 n=1 Tax=Trypanosoma vivax (strain Y486) TaxID=1055687 RepID=G0U539_TRYVY|nr:putative Microtubule binding protein MIP T3 [Trypanosoma vivax]CCC50987.1 conserved hypothetical protein [Trypanosoma vivax Y486]